MLSINTERLAIRLEELAQIGAREDGGVCRLAFSDDDLKGRNYVSDILNSLGMEVRIDAIGNLFGILNGTSDLPAVMIGSHTDTVGTGGKYDGALGVLAAVEAAERLIESESPRKRTLIVASFVNEEGVRFMPDMMGSLIHSGHYSINDARQDTDINGTTIGEELDRLSYGGKDSLDDLNVGCFLELHIEQGPILEDARLEIGVVTGVQGLSWTQVEVNGSTNHAGTTPMDRRKDAGTAAGRMTEKLRALPKQYPDLRLTIGSTVYEPGLINVIPERVRFTIDARHPDSDTLKRVESEIQLILKSEDVCQVDNHSLARVEPCTFSPSVVEAVADAAQSHDLSHTNMISGAGHDAQILTSCYECGMVFVPSRSGISHNVTEYTSPEHVRAGANVLLSATHTLLERD